MPSIRPAAVFAAAPPSYDVRDQNELRRAMAQVIATATQATGTDGLDANIQALPTLTAVAADDTLFVRDATTGMSSATAALVREFALGFTSGLGAWTKEQVTSPITGPPPGQPDVMPPAYSTHNTRWIAPINNVNAALGNGYSTYAGADDIAYSTDNGDTWTLSSTGYTDRWFNQVRACYLSFASLTAIPARKCLDIGGSITDGIVTTADGVTFAKRTAPDTLVDIAANGTTGVAFDGDSSDVYTTTNGTSWTQQATTGGASFWARGVWASDVSLWLALGWDANDDLALYSSANATTWTVRYTFTGYENIYSFVYAGLAWGDGKGIAVTKDGWVRSTNGTAWTYEAWSGTHAAADVSDVCFAGAGFLAVGATGEGILVSTDGGVSWSYTAGLFTDADYTMTRIAANASGYVIAAGGSTGYNRGIYRNQYAGLTTGTILRATGVTSTGFGALDLTNVNAVDGTLTANTLLKWTSGGAVGDSLVSESGSTVTVGGTLTATAIQNTPIGATTATSGRFTTLDTSGNNTLGALAGVGTRMVTASAAGLLATQAIPTGDVVGPSSATDNALVRWDGTTGKLVQNSNATLADNGALALAPTTTFGFSVLSTSGIQARVGYDGSNYVTLNVLSDGQVEYNAVGSNPHHSFQDRVSVQSTGGADAAFAGTKAVDDLSSVVGFTATTQVTSTTAGTITNIYGHRALARTLNSTVPTVTNLYGLEAQVLQTGSGVVTNGYGLNITASGTYGTLYGLHIAAMTGGSTNYALYTNAGLVRFGDVVNTTESYQVDGTRVVTNRLTAVTKPTGGAVIDAEARTAIDAIIDRLRATGGHGLIAD